MRGLSGTVRPGFVLFNDLTHVDSMDPECAPVLGEIMDQCAKMGLGASLRVIPSAKDIGLNLIARFHYPPKMRSQTYETLSEGTQRCGSGDSGRVSDLTRRKLEPPVVTLPGHNHGLRRFLSLAFRSCQYE